MVFTKYRYQFRKPKRVLAVILAGCLLTAHLAGCGKAGQETESQTVGGEGAPASGQADPAPALGRYVETEFAYDEDCVADVPQELLPWGDGLYLVDAMGRGVWADLAKQTLSGAEEAVCPPALAERFANNDYFTEMAMAENGARMYTVFSSAGEGRKYYYEKYFLAPDGTETPWETIARESSASIIYGRDGYFYLADSWERDTTAVYRVDSEDGETEFLFEVDGRVNYFAGCGRYLLMDIWDDLKIYDLDTREECEEDSVLNNLLSGFLGVSNGNYSYGYLLYPGEENSIYVVTDKGLYRHVLYGSVAEQLIDGSLCSLSDTSYFVDMYAGGAQEEMPVFYLLYEGGRMVRFAYDAQVPSVPENSILLYSLYEDGNIQDLISAYRVRHPEVYVRYEIGITGQDGATKEDALKNLATALAAGEGPDILLLDDLPYASYMEKGVLMDLSGLYEGLRQEYEFYDNFISAFKKGDALYVLPQNFMVPVLMGDAAVLSGIHSAEDMAAALKNARAMKGAAKAGLVDEVTVLQSLSFGCGDTFTKEDGSLDREAVTAFLELCRQVYEADRENLTQEEIEERFSVWKRWNDFVEADRPPSQQIYYVSKRAESAIMGALMYGDCFGIGTLGGGVQNTINTFYATLAAANWDYMLLPGENRAGLPVTMLGINAASPVSGEAQKFVEYALGEYLCENENFYGVPVNKDAFFKQMENPYKDEQGNPSYEPYVYMGSSVRNADGSEGKHINIDVAWCRPEVYEKFSSMFDSVDAVGCCESMLRDCLLEEGAKALRGEQGIEESVNAIERKLQLYLAE